MTDSKPRSARSIVMDRDPLHDDIGFNVDALARAQAVIERFKEAYITESAPDSLARLEELAGTARREPADRRACVAAIYRIAHDMKGQGSTFGLPLLTEIGRRLCDLTIDSEAVGEAELPRLDAHLAAIRMVIAERICDLDGPDAERVLGCLGDDGEPHRH